MAKLDRDYLDLERTVALAAATGTTQHVTGAALKVDFVQARIRNIRSIATEVEPLEETTVLDALEDRLQELDARLMPLTRVVIARGGSLPEDGRAQLEAMRRDLLAGPRPTLKAATDTAARATDAIQTQARNLAHFRTLAQGVLGVGGLCMILTLILFVRARVTAAELRRSREHYRQLFRGNAAIMLLVDPIDGHIVEGNQAAVDFYGYTQDELRGKPIGEINVTDPEP